MADPKLLDVDPLTGKRMWYQFDKDDHRESKDAHTITTVYDAEPVLRAAHDRRNEDDHSGRKFYGQDMRHACYIPAWLNQKLAERDITYPGGGIKDDNAFRKWYNSEEGAPYRTIRGMRL